MLSMCSVVAAMPFMSFVEHALKESAEARYKVSSISSSRKLQ